MTGQAPDRSRAIPLGVQLRKVRNRLGLSLEQVEGKFGFDAMRIGTYERGDRTCSAAFLCELAEAYGVRFVDLLPPEWLGEAGEPLAPLDEAKQLHRRLGQVLGTMGGGS